MRYDFKHKKYLLQVSILSTTGGRNGNQVVYRVMAELMTDDLMLLHTFKGQTGKEAFKNTLFFSCVCGKINCTLFRL